MATERTTLLRRPSRLIPRMPRGVAVVPPGTSGLKDQNPIVRSVTARAMVGKRQKIDVACEAEGCIDPRTGKPRVFKSRVVNGEPERKGCSGAHRMRIWRAKMQQHGYRQVIQDGVLGWTTPDGRFHPMPSQPKRQRHQQRRARAEVTPESG